MNNNLGIHATAKLIVGTFMVDGVKILVVCSRECHGIVS